MKTVKTISSLRKILKAARRAEKTIGFVPTMGYFHEGHLALMRRAKRENDVAVVSLFVNPIQFGPHEDLSKYPRDFKRDSAMARTAGVDILFVPPVEEIYPTRLLAHVDVERVSEGLCGASRPGHFRGVATVVAKLMNIVQPEVIYLGQKDAQQVAVIKKMVGDLNFPVKVSVCPTVREPDGLAMSSRNVYLSPTERKQAAVLYRALQHAARQIASGEPDVKKIIREIKKLILEESGATIDYVSVVDLENFQPVRRINDDVLVALAVKFGSTRLIDNIVIPLARR